MTEFEELVLKATAAMLHKPFAGDLTLLNAVVRRIRSNKLEGDYEVVDVLAQIKVHTMNSEHEMTTGKLIRLFGLIKEFEIKDSIKLKSVFKVSQQYVHITQNTKGDVVQMSLFTKDLNELSEMSIL